MKAHWESGGIAPRILDLGARWRWVVRYTPRPRYPKGRSPWYPLCRRLGGPQSRSGCSGEGKNPQSLPGLEPPIIQPVTQRYTTSVNPLRFCRHLGQLTGYGLVDRMIGVRFPAGAGNFSLRHRVQTGYGTHPASYSMGTGGSFPGDKAVRMWSWPLTSV
jgi:hypothetical protein